MTYADACERAVTIARNFEIYMTVVKHPTTGEYADASLSEINRPKDWSTNPEAYPNLCHVVATVNPWDLTATPRTPRQ